MKSSAPIWGDLKVCFKGIFDLLWVLFCACAIPLRWLLILSMGVNLIDLIFVHKWFLVGMFVAQAAIYYFLTWILANIKVPSEWKIFK